MTERADWTNLGAFVAICLVWGLSWSLIRSAVETVPPLFFGATRFLVAGAVLLLAADKSWIDIARRRWARVLIAALVINTACYGFYCVGLRTAPSGLAAAIGLGLTPPLLFAFGLASGQERFRARRLAGLLVGAAGLTLLLCTRTERPDVPGEVSGLFFVLLGTVAYCLGSVLSLVWLRDLSPVALAGLTSLVGGAAGLALSLATESIGFRHFALLTAPPVVWSWMFLVIGGSFVAFTGHFRLLKAWGPARTGLYAFVSPLIALVIGVVAFGEDLGAVELASVAILLGAARLAWPSALAPTSGHDQRCSAGK